MKHTSSHGQDTLSSTTSHLSRRSIEELGGGGGGGGGGGACLPDVVELPVQDAHGLGIRVGLDAAPVGCGGLIAPGLHHLHAQANTAEQESLHHCAAVLCELCLTVADYVFDVFGNSKQ